MPKDGGSAPLVVGNQLAHGVGKVSPLPVRHTAGRGIGLKGLAVGITHPHLATDPRSTDLDGVVGPVVIGLKGLEQRQHVGAGCQDGAVASDNRMVALGFGKFARADRIFALERITGEERGDGQRTRVWIDGVADPLIASRTEGTILRDMGQEAAVVGPQIDEALDLAARLAAAAEAGRVDLSDLGRRARRLLASTTASSSE